MGTTVRGMDQVVIALLEAPNIERDASDTFGRIALIEATRGREYRLSKLFSHNRENGLPIDPSDDDDNESVEDDLICDICGAWASREAAYHCSICSNGNFDICEECKERGAIRLDDTHQMTKR